MVGSAGEFAEHPLAVTGLYGQGVVTMVTFDVGNPEFEAQMNKNEVGWIGFWNQMAGWQNGDRIITAAQYEKEMQARREDLTPSPCRRAKSTSASRSREIST